MDLSDLMRSPELALEPSPGLARDVRRSAAALRRRRRAAAGAGAVTSLVLALGGAVVVPGLVSEDRLAPSEPATVAGATTPVIVLGDLNGAEAVTYWKGRSWCYGVSRVTTTHGCTNGIRGGDDFPAVAGPAESALRVDDGQASERQLVAGLLGDRVATVEVLLVDEKAPATGQPDVTRSLAATQRRVDFPRGVWWFEVPRGLRVTGYIAYDVAGARLTSRTG